MKLDTQLFDFLFVVYLLVILIKVLWNLPDSFVLLNCIWIILAYPILLKLRPKQ